MRCWCSSGLRSEDTNVTTSDITYTTPKRPWGAIVWLIISQLIGLLSLLPWFVIAGLSLMAFDSGGTAQAWAFAGAIWCYPVLPIGSAIVAWILFAVKKKRAALIVTSLPLLVAVPLVIYLVVVWLSNFFPV